MMRDEVDGSVIKKRNMPQAKDTGFTACYGCRGGQESGIKRKNQKPEIRNSLVANATGREGQERRESVEFARIARGIFLAFAIRHCNNRQQIPKERREECGHPFHSA
ncbi:MAG: hypothetical protein LBO00_06240 [Zoogloeaceae bacterium]|nr:hypothetical protein [Zoogloeaceae bacterium]